MIIGYHSGEQAIVFLPPVVRAPVAYKLNMLRQAGWNVSQESERFMARHLRIDAPPAILAGTRGAFAQAVMMDQANRKAKR